MLGAYPSWNSSLSLLCRFLQSTDGLFRLHLLHLLNRLHSVLSHWSPNCKIRLGILFDDCSTFLIFTGGVRCLTSFDRGYCDLCLWWHFSLRLVNALCIMSWRGVLLCLILLIGGIRAWLLFESLCILRVEMMNSIRNYFLLFLLRYKLIEMRKRVQTFSTVWRTCIYLLIVRINEIKLNFIISLSLSDLVLRKKWTQSQM